MTDAVIVTTTINVPTEAFEKYASVAPLIVVGDVSTPAKTKDLVNGLGGMYVLPELQEGWECSKNIGWKTIQRRNIGFLVAYQTGADIAITVDDDNAPDEPQVWLAQHLAAFDQHTRPTWTTLAESGVFNPGSMLSPYVVARGMPYGEDYTRDTTSASDATIATTDWSDLRVGVNAGLWFGDPDIDAMQRITQAPYVTSTKSDRDTLVSPHTFAPINSQNTAWRRELLPLAAVWPFTGRWDDIFGGYLAQWSFWAAGFATRYGYPIVTQDRNDHDLYTDLEREVFGMRNTAKFLDTLRTLPATGNPLYDIRTFADYISINPTKFGFPSGLKNFLYNWVADWRSLGMELTGE